MNAREKKFINQARERFIEERTKGYRDRSGEYHAPVARPTALRAWGKHRPNILKAVNDPAVRRTFKLDQA